MGFAADHLRVAGNRGERIFEFVRDARGHFAEGREIFLPANLFLQRGEFGQIAHQAERAADFHLARCARADRLTSGSHRSVRDGAINGRNRDAKMADVAARK